MLERLFDLKQKKALVTGGGRGVGRACATALAQAGADVAIVGRTKDAAERTCAALRAFGVCAFFVKCDVSDPVEIDEMIGEIVERFGRIDIAVNNAGWGVASTAIDTQKEEWEQTFAVNLSGAFWCAQAQARQMSKQKPIGGKIINVASMYATIAGGNCAYNASKAGLVHLTRSLAAEWGAENINVNSISPGWMLTPGNFISMQLRRRMREVTPMGSLMRYEDIFGAVVYLASAASDFVTGHDLVIDGGHTINTWLAPLERRAPARTSPDEEEVERRKDIQGSDS